MSQTDVTVTATKDETAKDEATVENTETMDAEAGAGEKETKPEAEGDDLGSVKPEHHTHTHGLRRDSADNEDKDTVPVGESTRTNSTTRSHPATHKVVSQGGFKIRPDLPEKFRPGVVQSAIEKILREFLEGRSYSAEDSPQWTRSLTNEIHAKVKALDYKRYKIVTFVVLGENRGGGVSVSNRCLWDADSDCKATYKFINDSLFCVGSVYGFYFY